jgi:hypothetical protein
MYLPSATRGPDLQRYINILSRGWEEEEEKPGWVLIRDQEIRGGDEMIVPWWEIGRWGDGDA